MALYLFAVRSPANAFIALKTLSLSSSPIQASAEHKHGFTAGSGLEAGALVAHL